ncbi:uncharacterized protein V1518DRAFT_415261 [Limtongia smithiae]|uniref:uncharacterized protein n=1 Tax=Limtongia smithiae TaxID=1125753 RepID=UPI0034CD618D
MPRLVAIAPVRHSFSYFAYHSPRAVSERSAAMLKKIIQHTPHVPGFTHPDSSVQHFLAHTRKAVQRGLSHAHNAPVLLVTGNESADLDSFTSSLLFAYLTSRFPREAAAKKAYKTIIPLLNITREEVSLRPELAYLLDTLHIPATDLICRDELLEALQAGVAPYVDVVLVDHNRLLGELAEIFDSKVIGVIDHHKDEGLYLTANPRIVESCGSCTSHVINYFADVFTAATIGDEKEAKIFTDIAKLGLAPIIVDTANLQSKAEEPDFDAAQILASYISSSHDPTQTVTAVAGPADSSAGATSAARAADTGAYFTALIEAKRAIDNFSLRDILRKDYKEWTEANGLKLGISSSTRSFAWTVSKFGVGEFKAGVAAWAKERDLDAFAFMDSFTTAEGEYRRDLFVCACTDKGKAPTAKFIASAKAEFNLCEYGDGDDKCGLTNEECFGAWRQGDTKASRKQVAPLMRKCICGM